MDLYKDSMSGIYRNSLGEHLKFIGWQNGYARYRSLATDQVSMMTKAEASAILTPVKVVSEDIPLQV